MKPIEISKAYTAVQELSKTIMPYVKAREVSKLRKILQEEIDIIIEHEKELATSCNGEELKDGGYKFKDYEDAKEYETKFSTFMNQEVDLSLPVVDLSGLVGSLTLSPDSIDALEGIIKFDKEE